MMLKTAIGCGFIMGFLARILTLKSDYRRYPTYPQGYAIHAVLGAVSSAIGALIIPSIIAGEYTAVSFFALAVQQFREVKNAERDTLINLEQDEIVKRGSGYIEDIARKFEVRNYLSMITAFFVSLSVLILKHALFGVGVGLIFFILIKRFVSEKYIYHIAKITTEDITFDNQFMVVGSETITNFGTSDIINTWQSKGVAIKISPKDDNAKMTLQNAGQRQAILHDVVAQIGCEKGEPWQVPICKISGESIVLVILSDDAQRVVQAVHNCPIIESARWEMR